MTSEIDEVERKKAEKEKLERINEHKKKLTAQFTKLDSRSKKVVASLIDNAAFMMVTLEDLQKEMNVSGVISIYKNGENQYGTKKSPEVEVYNSMIKNHMMIMKQLTDLLPEEKKKPEDDGFEKFVNNRD